ncbi:MAG: crossover junction endodeoxyribonuclease RuvC [Candidatus Delongbacteria bacterium]|nr:crossover junction endodeoxyribonuclease RuvC [Candidatus Delongbacteria bacterium]MBN2836967.1 crossover junction endodeoxyribonuclease RuvC [Candidatus Delongbacteria bacterium]
MIVLGVDPGLGKTGFAVLEKNGRTITILEAGYIKTDTKADLPIRLTEIYYGLDEIIKTYNPDKVGVETVFAAKNISSTIKLSHARGTILLCSGLNKIDVSEFSPREVKQAITGSGSATKEQIIFMIRNLTGLKNIEGPSDAFDAISIGVAVLQSIRINHDRKTLR